MFVVFQTSQRVNLGIHIWTDRRSTQLNHDQSMHGINNVWITNEHMLYTKRLEVAFNNNIKGSSTKDQRT